MIKSFSRNISWFLLFCLIFVSNHSFVQAAEYDMPIYATLKEHTDQVNSLDFSPDSRKLASGSSDHTVKLWDVASGDIIKTFEGHTKKINEVQFSPNGNYIASASADNTIKLWNITDEDESVITLEGHSAEIKDIAFDHTGDKLYSISQDRTLRVWDTSTGEMLQQQFFSSPETLALNPVDKTIAVGLRDGSIHTVKNTDDGSINIKQYSVLNSPIDLVEYTPDGKYLIVSATYRTTPIFLEVENDYIQKELDQDTYTTKISWDSFKISQDQRFLIVGTINGFHIFDFHTGVTVKEQSQLDTKEIAITADGQYFANVSSTNEIQLRSAKNLPSEENTESPSEKSDLNGVAYNGDAFVAVGNDGTIVRSKDGKKWTSVHSPTKHHLHAIVWANNQFVVVGQKGTILTSADGVIWKQQLVEITQTLRNVMFASNSIYSYTSVGDIVPIELEERALPMKNGQSPDKNWVVRFNKEVHDQDLSGIVVMDAFKQPVKDVIVTANPSNLKQVIIAAPYEGYKPGIYQIVVKDVKSRAKEAMKEPVIMSFEVQ